VADDGERSEPRVAGVDPLDLRPDEVGEVVDAARVERPPETAEIERERAVPVAAQPPLEHVEGPPRGEEPVEKQHRPLAAREVGPLLDAIPGARHVERPRHALHVLRRPPDQLQGSPRHARTLRHEPP
jgi:hypothetical protein